MFLGTAFSRQPSKILDSLSKTGVVAPDTAVIGCSAAAGIIGISKQGEAKEIEVDEDDSEQLVFGVSISLFYLGDSTIQPFLLPKGVSGSPSHVLPSCRAAGGHSSAVVLGTDHDQLDQWLDFNKMVGHTIIGGVVPGPKTKIFVSSPSMTLAKTKRERGGKRQKRQEASYGWEAVDGDKVLASGIVGTVMVVGK